MRLLIAFPLIMIAALGIQLTAERLDHAQRVNEALEACYDSPDTTDEECELFHDAGSIHPSAQ